MAPATRLRIVYPRDLVFSALTEHSDKKAERACHGFYSAWARNTWIDAHATRTGRIIFKRPFPGHSVAALSAAIRPGKRTAGSNPRVGVSRVASSIRIEAIFSRRQSLQSALQPTRQVRRADRVSTARAMSAGTQRSEALELTRDGWRGHRGQVFAVRESTCALKCPVLHDVISLNLPRCPARDIKISMVHLSPIKSRALHTWHPPNDRYLGRSRHPNARNNRSSE